MTTREREALVLAAIIERMDGARTSLYEIRWDTPSVGVAVFDVEPDGDLWAVQFSIDKENGVTFRSEPDDPRKVWAMRGAEKMKDAVLREQFRRAVHEELDYERSLVTPLNWVPTGPVQVGEKATPALRHVLGVK